MKISEKTFCLKFLQILLVFEKNYKMRTILVTTHIYTHTHTRARARARTHTHMCRYNAKKN